MGIKYNPSLGGYTPICDECGTALCWDISPEEYEQAKEFWDSWTCRTCNPNYKGALDRWLRFNRKGPYEDA